MQILFLSPEAVPFAKTGGLADVAGALPAAMKDHGMDVRLVLPLYRTVRESGVKAQTLLEELIVPLGEQNLAVQILEGRTEEDVPVYLIQREDLYDRAGLYGNQAGDYYDNLERFTVFSHAALRLPETLGFKPHVIHGHDWQPGLVPALLRGPYEKASSLYRARTVFTIHNLGYQGIFPADKLSVTGLPEASFFTLEGLEFWGSISLLKAGIVYASAITTVSPTYAREIQTSEYGMGMEGALRERRAFLQGILNGVDYRLWDPATDAHIPANYALDKMHGKGRCKEVLIHEMGLDPSLRQKPLLGMVSRLDGQKGVNLVLEVMEDILALDVGLVVLGTGDRGIQETLRKEAEGHRGHVGLTLGFDEPLAHRIMAGADIFLIPSRYEPCGLTQMYALKYGTIPVVRATGGLDDTVVQFDGKTGKGNGFKFVPFDSAAFLNTLREAVDLFGDSVTWQGLMAKGMREDFSWNRSAQAYLELYESLQRP